MADAGVSHRTDCEHLVFVPDLLPVEMDFPTFSSRLLPKQLFDLVDRRRTGQHVLGAVNAKN
jgi:hypothetical protein